MTSKQLLSVAEEHSVGCPNGVGGYSCMKEQEISHIFESLKNLERKFDSMRNVKLTVIISVVIAVLSGAGFLFSIQANQGVVSTKVSSIEEDVSELKDSVHEIREDRDETNRQIMDSLRKTHDAVMRIDRTP